MPNLKDILKAGFPFLSAGLGVAGPIGQMAANALGLALGLSKANPSPDDIQSALSKGMTPDQISALKDAEQKFQLQMQQLQFQHSEDLEALAEKDRESARNREIQVRDKTPRNLAYGVTVLCLSAELLVLFHGPGHTDPVVVGRILGMLDSALMLVLSYYYGSSRGSDDKNQIIKDLTK